MGSGEVVPLSGDQDGICSASLEVASPRGISSRLGARITLGSAVRSQACKLCCRRKGPTQASSAALCSQSERLFRLGMLNCTNKLTLPLRCLHHPACRLLLDKAVGEAPLISSRKRDARLSSGIVSLRSKRDATYPASIKPRHFHERLLQLCCQSPWFGHHSGHQSAAVRRVLSSYSGCSRCCVERSHSHSQRRQHTLSVV